MNKTILAAISVLAFSAAAHAQITQTTGPCDVNAASCSESTQNVGNPTTTSDANNAVSTSSSNQLGNSANSNGNSFTTTNNNTPQNEMSNGANTSTNSANNTSQGGAGGSATGNLSNNTSSTSVKGGNQTSSTTGGAQSNTGGAQANSNGQNVGNGSNSVGTTVNANTTSSYKAIYIPPVVPPTPASQLAVGNIVKETLACGPLMQKTSQTVEGTYFGLVINSKFEQGHDDTVAPLLDVNGNETYHDVPFADSRGVGFHRYGSQVVMFTAIVGLAGARNIAIGTGGSNGGWGQGGMGASGSIQQMVTTVQILPCDMGSYITTPKIEDPAPLTKIHQ